jgi:hypothetical protein
MATTRPRAPAAALRGRPPVAAATWLYPPGAAPRSTTRAPGLRDWLKFKNPAAPAVKREFEEDWGKTRNRLAHQQQPEYGDV